MTAPLAGIRVVEVANWLAAPAAAALMSDLGADVIKVEAPGGDVLRHFDMKAYGYTDYDFPTNSVFELDNRGKRSIVLALDKPGAPKVIHRLIERADVLVLNLTAKRRERYGLDEAAVRVTNPTIVYAALTGYGSHGPDADRPGFDYAAFWARSGIMNGLTNPPMPPPLCRGGQGDHATSLNLLAAVLVALRLREQTGEGQSLEVTLQGTGMWTVAADLSAASLTRQVPPPHDHEEAPNPIWNVYETRDGRWVLLVMPAPEPYWPRFCRAIGRPEWADDERYDTMAKRQEASRELCAEISAAFAEQTLKEWGRRLDAEGLIWAPSVDFVEVVNDPQPREMGSFTQLQHPEGGPFETLAAPFQIRGADVRPRGVAPRLGEHGRDILRELEFADDEIAALEESGALGPSDG